MSAAHAPVERLRKRADFLRAARRGRKVAKSTVVVQAVARSDGARPMRVGVTATKKLGGAVVRNRVKRRLRAAAAELLPQRGEPGTDYVLIGRAATATCPWTRLKRDLDGALEGLARARAPRPEHA